MRTSALTAATSPSIHMRMSSEWVPRSPKPPTPATLAAGWVDVANPVTLEIAGTEGHAVVFNDALYFESKKVPGSKSTEPWTRLPAALPLPMNQFVDAVRGVSGQPLVSAREAAARVAVMEATYASARQGRWVEVA